MRLTRCVNGHMYDLDRGPDCPLCAASGSTPDPPSIIPPRPMDPFAPAFPLPLCLHEYSVDEELGRGSTGVVYQISKTTRRALKVIRWDRPGMRENARREFAAGKLFADCPYTIRLMDYYEQDDTSYILQELAEPLMRRWRQYRPTAGDILRAALDVCEALAAIHRMGYQHYDVKPGNLFLSDSGVKLGDFSHCAPFEAGVPHRHVTGTYQFAAPEIVTLGPCSGREDIYSFGVCLYMLLSGGSHPFPLQFRDPPVRRREDRLRTLFLHPELTAIIEKATAYDPADRYAAIEEAAADVRRVMEQFGDSIEERVPFSFRDDASTLTPDSQFQFTGTTWPLYEEEPYTSVMLSEPEPRKTEGRPVPAEPSPARSSADGDCFSRRDPVPDASQADTEPAFPPPPIPAPDAAAPAPRLDGVQFTVVAEKNARPEDARVVEIAMYAPEDKQSVLQEIQAEFDEPTLQKSSHLLEAQRNTCVAVVLSARGVEIQDDRVEYRWTGKPLRFSFGYNIPQDFQGHQILFKASVYFDGVIATTLLFTVNVDRPDADVRYDRSDVRSAFLSYSREDIGAVTYILQTLKKIRPDLDIFFDIETLRSGENWAERLYSEIRKRDKLFLCWSRSAARSEWVNREWRCMAEAKGLDAIEPFPLESPDVCPVPEGLEGLHFDDVEVLIRRAKQMIRQAVTLP